MAQARQLTPMPAATHETLIGLLAVTGCFSAGHPLRRKPIFAFAQFRG